MSIALRKEVTASGYWRRFMYARPRSLNTEMFGSDRSRPKDYRRAVVIDAGLENKTNEPSE